MKAIIISSLLFFSLRAMSSEVGEDKKGECIFGNQGGREAKEVIVNAPVSIPAKEKTSIAK